MMDTDTFLTTLYVMADDFCKYQLPPEKTTGPQALFDPRLGSHPGPLRTVELLPQRARLLPLRQSPPAPGFPHLALPGSVQPPDAAAL